MRLIVDKQPKESSDCLFFDAKYDGNGGFQRFCTLNDEECIHCNEKCSYLKEYKPNKVNVKISRKRDKK